MRILALETSSLAGSLAVLEDARLLAQLQLNPQQRTAQAFAPGIQRLLADVGWRSQDLELIAVTIGPGSFTGLRIGVTAAKTLAYAVGAEVIGINTLQVIAAQTPAGVEQVWAVLNAQRQQFFVGSFRRQDGAWLPIAEPSIVDAEPWLRALPPGAALSGAGLTKLRQPMPAGVTVVAESSWTPRAETVGQLGYLAYRSGSRDDLWKLSPLYYRPSAAEEVWEAKQ